MIFENKTTEPKISIILPVFNGGLFLAKTIQSVISQSLHEFELIIVNDASIDNSKEIIFSFEDSRIIYIENSINVGQIESVNKGIKLAKANLISRIDQDDIFLQEKLSLQYQFLDENKDISVVGTWASIIDANDKVKRYISSPVQNNKMVNTLLNSNPLFHPSVVIRKDILIKMGMYSKEYEYTEDYDLWCRLVLSDHKIANIPKYLLKYREHNNQSSKENNSIQLLNALKIRDIFFKKILTDLIKIEKVILKGFTSFEISEIAYTCSDILGQRGSYKESKMYLFIAIKNNKLNIKSYLMLFLIYSNCYMYQKIVIKKNILRSKLVDLPI